MEMENKYNRTIRKEDVDIGMQYTITRMKYVTTKYGNILDLFVPKHFDSKAAEFEKKFKKPDIGMNLSVMK